MVIAAPVGEESATNDFGEHSWALAVVGMNTRFEVRHTLKGKADGKELLMLHFRFVDPPKGKLVIIDDPPGLVVIRHKTLNVREGKSDLDLPAPEYLLFLRRLKDGRYEPVSGQKDANLAVREVSPPLDDTFNERK